MKTTAKIMAFTTALVGFLTAGELNAQVTNVITFTATAKPQSRTNDNGTVTSAAAPTPQSVTTKALLKFLAQDEYAEGKYGSTNFPAGAKLVVINDHGCPLFQVLTSGNIFLVDVSDIVSVQAGRLGNDIISGKRNDLTGLASTSMTDLHVLTIGFDDFQVNDQFGEIVGLQFYMTGLMSSVTTDTTPTSAGVYTETRSGKLTSGVGEGDFQGKPFVITGGLTVTGKATFKLP